MVKKNIHYIKSKNAKKIIPDKKRSFVWLFLILLVSFFAYASILHNGFVNWDDDDYIRNNILIRTFNLKDIFSQNVMGNYHPLTILAFAIQYYFFGLNETGYHATSIILHSFNVILVFYFILQLSDKTGIAVIAALLFGIHPIHVESVAWASELKDLLYAFFFLASCVCYLKYTNKNKIIFYFCALILFLLSLFSKAMAISLPLVFILIDYFKGRKWNLKILAEKFPFIILSIIFGLIAVHAQKEGGAIRDIAFYTFPQRIIFANFSFITYLSKLILPVNLSAFYPYPVKPSMDIPLYYFLFAFLLLSLIIYIFYSIRFTKKIFFGIGFFALTVFIVLQLLPVGEALMADRYIYIPSIGIFYLIGEGVILLWRTKYKIPIIASLGLLSVFYIAQTKSRCLTWKDSLALWNDVIKNIRPFPLLIITGVIISKLTITILMH